MGYSKLTISTPQRRSGCHRLNCIVGAVSDRPLSACHYFRCPTIFVICLPTTQSSSFAPSLSSQLRISAKFRKQQIFRIFSTFSFQRECRAQLGSNDRTTRPGVEVDRGEVLRVVGEVEEELAEVELRESMTVDRRRSRSRPRRGSSRLVSKLSTSTVARVVAVQFGRDIDGIDFFQYGNGRGCQGRCVG